MRATPVDLIGGFYTDESLPWSCQDTVNYLPVRAEAQGTRTPTKLVDAPGLKPWVWIGNFAEDPVPGGPIRGLHDVEGKLFAVSGTTLYRISTTGVAIPLGTIPGTGRVSMAHNQIAGGNQLLVVNGSSGYVYNTVADTFERVVDASYPGASIAEFIDGYLMQLEPFGRFLLFSDLADALAYNALDRFEAETAPDLTAGLAILHQEVWALGERTIDVFENVGTGTGTFRNKGISISRGCMARWSTAVIDNGLAWLGDDGVVYHARGYDPVRISTRAIEVALAESTPANLSNAFAYVWQDRGHAVYYITVPNGQTFGYDFSTGLWHRRASYSPVTDISGRWRLNDLVRSNGRWIGGDYQTGKLYTLDWDYMLEGEDTPHVRERVAPPAHNNQNRFTVDYAEIIFDTGGPETVPVAFPSQPVGPDIEGNSPDGLTGDPYTFTYTTIEGDAPIARTVLLDVTLPAGWEWDQTTATISHPEEVTATIAIQLRMRVFDTNGLYADHEDVVLIVADQMILITGSSILGGPMFAGASTLGELTIEGISQSTGADLAGAMPVYYDGTWLAVGPGGSRYATDILDSWTTGTTPFGSDRPYALAGGPAGWLVSNAQEFKELASAGDPPSSFALLEYNIVRGEESFPAFADDSFSMCRYIGGYYYAVPNQYPGFLIRSETLVGDWTGLFKRGDDGHPNGDTISAFYDICEFEGDLYATVNFRPLSNQRTQLRKSTDGGLTWPTVLVDTPVGTLDAPFQIEAGGDFLLVVSWGSRTVRTSADGFATTYETGLASQRASDIEDEERGRQIVYSAPRFYLISGNAPTGETEKGNKCVSTLDGTEFSTLANIPIGNAWGIATDYVEPGDG